MAQKPSATKLRSFRSFVLMQQFAAAEIGARIAQARKEADAMTQDQLAELLNVSTRSVQEYERGATIPWKHFTRLEQIFDHDLRWFLHGEQNPAPAELDLESLVGRLEFVVRRLEVLFPGQAISGAEAAAQAEAEAAAAESRAGSRASTRARRATG